MSAGEVRGSVSGGSRGWGSAFQAPPVTRGVSETPSIHGDGGQCISWTNVMLSPEGWREELVVNTDGGGLESRYH